MKLLLTALLALSPLLGQDEKPAERLEEAASVLSEIMAATDTSIPQDLLTDAHCIVIVPGLKTAAFVFGGKYGKGYLSCRRETGKGWSAPGTVRIEGGSVGFQIGGSSTDLIMLVMSERGADTLLSSKFTLGAEGSVAAGPVGRTATAQTDVQMKADILSWSRSQGLFAGVALAGATLRQDLDDNATLYGERLENHEIVTTDVSPPPAATELLALLNKHSVREGLGMTSASDRLEARKASPSHARAGRASMRPDDIKQVQKTLNDKGFNVGPVDGVIGARTRAGIRSFQKAQQLPVTGWLDKETTERLGVGTESLVGKL